MTDQEQSGPLTLNVPFGLRYVPLRVLGAGGMGAVYQVWDNELGQTVALKVIRPAATNDSEAAYQMQRRFKKELVLARQVTHRNVVRIHDLGEVNGIKYITMPYLDGSDLATALRKETKLLLPTALRIVRDISSGLVAAHDAGVVHRDLKPANIMLVDGHAIILDFGIARSMSNSGVGLDIAEVSGFGTAHFSPLSNVTIPGTVLGTLEYMAPEQAKGQAVDHRADIYAVGLIFGDMLLGRTRLSDCTAFEELQRRIARPLTPVRTFDPLIPEPVARIISKCVEIDPANRFQTATELAAELGRLDETGNLRSEGTIQHDPVSVLIADFQNDTKDAAFDGALEPVLKLALEGASFVNAYSRNEIARIFGVVPPQKLNEEAALRIAVQHGLNVVLSGIVSRQNSRYTLSMRALQTVTGEEIGSVTGHALNKDRVVQVATDLAAQLRGRLGDNMSDSSKRFAMETLSATSLDVVREYAGAMDALSRSQFEEARQRFARTLALDSGFGLGYLGLATVSRNLGKQTDAEAYAKQAVSHVDNMTERERYRTRGMYYLITGDYHAAAREYGDLISRYAADAAARNNLALCATHLRDMPKALKEMQEVTKLLPGRALYRVNLALYRSYSGDFQAAAQEALAMKKPGLFGTLALAFGRLGLGLATEAAEAYLGLESLDVHGKSYMASGLGDLAAFEGRFSEAESLLLEGASDDLSADDPDRAAAKFAKAAYVRIQQGRIDAAVESALDALRNSKLGKIRFLAARVFVDACEIGRAQGLAEGLRSESQAELQTYGMIIEANIATKDGNPHEAVKRLLQANDVLDTWIGHFDLGRAYLETQAFLHADSEFERCLARRGEALSLFLDEEPTFSFLPPLYYYQGRARQMLNTPGFVNSCRAYLAIRGSSSEDPRTTEVRQCLHSV